MTLLKTCGVSRMVTVNSHNPKLLKTMPVSTEDLSAFSLLAEHFKNKGLKGVFSASLGKKGLDVAAEADKTLNGGYGYVPTQRNRMTGEVTIEKRSFPVKGRDVVVFDDVMSSGKSMAKAVAWIKKQGAGRVYVACVHVILVGDGKDHVLKSGAESIIGTDSVPGPLSEVSIAPLIANALKTQESA
jgi:ribose-phosphate pyrophosphokinase